MQDGEHVENYPYTYDEYHHAKQHGGITYPIKGGDSRHGLPYIGQVNDQVVNLSLVRGKSRNQLSDTIGPLLSA